MKEENYSRKLGNPVWDGIWYEKIYALCQNTGIKITWEKIWESVKIDTTDDVIFFEFFCMIDEKKS